MQEIRYHGPENQTSKAVDHVNELIALGKPTDEVLHTALTWIFGLLGQTDHMAKETREDVDILRGKTPEKRRADLEESSRELMDRLKSD